jgi:CRP-like cAMP-binding protein
MFDGIKEPTVYEKNQFIFQQDDSAKNIYYLRKGRVKSFVISLNGSEKTIAVFSEGSIFGKASFFANVPHFTSAKAVLKSEIIVIDKEMIMDIFVRHPQFAVNMLEDLSNTIRMLSNQIENMSFHNADKRIALFLMDNKTSANIIPCTHDEISAIIGASRITVSKALSRFAKKGWIQTEYRQIKITNPAELVTFINI